MSPLVFLFVDFLQEDPSVRCLAEMLKHVGTIHILITLSGKLETADRAIIIDWAPLAVHIYHSQQSAGAPRIFDILEILLYTLLKHMNLQFQICL